MDFAYTDEEGKYLVQMARKSLTFFLENKKKLPIPQDCPPKLKEKSGIFVTINGYRPNHTERDLRGCIGRPFPEDPLIKAAIDSAVDAGVGDPRFHHVRKEDLEKIIFEITALTPPVPIKANSIEELYAAIEIGRDGLIIEGSRKYGRGAGLFLPQVPIEQKWNKEEYLIELCGKAGIDGDAWRDLKETTISKFQGEIFEEESPKGAIKRIVLQ